MPYFAKRAATKRPIPLGATVRFTHSAEAIPHDIVVSAKVWGPPITHGRDAARPSAGVPIAHEAMYGQIWDYATPSAAWVVLPDRTARLVAVRDMAQISDSDMHASLALLTRDEVARLASDER